MGIFKRKKNDKGQQERKKGDLGFIIIFFLIVVVSAYAVFALVKDRATTYIQPNDGTGVSIDLSDTAATIPYINDSAGNVPKEDESLKEASLVGGTGDYEAFDPEKEADGVDYESLDFYQKAKEYQEATEGMEEIDPSTFSSNWNDYTADMRNAPYTADGNNEELITDKSNTYPAAAYTVLYKILDNYGWTHYQLLDTGYENDGYYLMYIFAVGYSNGMKAEYSIYYAPTDNIAWGVRIQEGYYEFYPSPTDDGWVSLK